MPRRARRRPRRPPRQRRVQRSRRRQLHVLARSRKGRRLGRPVDGPAPLAPRLSALGGRLMRSALLVLLLAIAPVAAFAAPVKPAALRAELLRTGPDVPTAAQWSRLGDDVEARLADAARDPSLVAGARSRAVMGLG